MEIKRQLKSLNNKTGQVITGQIKHMIKQHDKYRKSYLWHVNTDAEGRRKQEFEDSLIFCLDGKKYEWEQELSLSAKNYYWTSVIYVDGAKTNITTMKKLVNA